MGIDLKTIKRWQYRQFPVVQHVPSTPQRLYQKRSSNGDADASLTTRLKWKGVNFNTCVLILNCALAMAINTFVMEIFDAPAQRNVYNLQRSWENIMPNVGVDLWNKTYLLHNKFSPVGCKELQHIFHAYNYPIGTSEYQLIQYTECYEMHNKTDTASIVELRFWSYELVQYEAKYIPGILAITCIDTNSLLQDIAPNKVRFIYATRFGLNNGTW